MHSRQSRRISSRMTRTKSMSSVSTRQHSIPGNNSAEANSPKGQALAAATRAFSRSNGPGREMRATNELPGRQNSRKTRATSHFHPLARKKSSRLSSLSQSHLRFGKRGASGSSFEKRRASRTSFKFAESSQNHSSKAKDRHLTESAFDAQEAFENSLGSLPSSYRRVRKAKSAYIFRSTGSRDCSKVNGHEISRDFSKYKPASSQPVLRDSRSTPALRHSRSQSNEYRGESQHEDAVIRLARERYLKDLETQRMKPRSSSLFSVLLRKPSELAQENISGPVTENRSGMGSLEDRYYTTAANSVGVTHRAQVISSSIRTSFKRVFRRSRAKQVPRQHVSSDRPYFKDYMPSSSEFHEHYRNVPLPDRHTLSSMHSREALLPEQSNRDSRYGSYSIRSSQTQGTWSNLRSRVTSWSSSSVDDDTTLRLANDVKRLSVIDEDGGPYHSSSSTGHKNVERGLSVFQYPMYDIEDSSKPKIPSTRRLYSALMKRLDNSSQRYKRIQNFPAIDGNHSREPFDSLGIPRRVNTDFSQRTFQTIRRVQTMPETENLHPEKSVSFPQLRYVYDDNEKPDFRSSGNHSSSAGVYVRQTLGHSPRKTQHGQPLREIRSSFYPHSSESRMVSPSPFNRARADQRISRDSSGIVIQKRAGCTHLEPISIHPSESVAESMSIYSRTTGGKSPLPDDHDNPKVFEAGTATIIQSPQTKSLKTFPSLRVSSDKSNQEWQAWMSSEVAKLETLDTDKIRLISDPERRKGHRREHAQIEEDTEIANPEGSETKSIPLPGLISSSAPLLSDKLTDRLPSGGVDRHRPLTVRSSSQTNVEPKRQGSLRNSPARELSPRKPSANENENPSVSPLKSKQASQLDAISKSLSFTPGSSGQISSLPAGNRDISRGSIEIPVKVNSSSPKSQENANRRTRYSPGRTRRSPYAGGPSAGRLKQSMLEPFEPSGQQLQRAVFSGQGRGENVDPVESSAATGSQAMVENFLRTRRINMEDRVSEEDNSAFL
ncbi:hypothetical protein L228DRAFT_142218 [Xylona heveae TC161]|uniref:Uncharacterized protein n=1 Tax=Xylona heveae (strain CBS 132557 / TC161) TaxID=1328760 RepID=A0A165H690_XYLHT|nr:hypothetical protein L228DRAFT_142218 [Xylona heveae TC161]KZF23045.1 hypothetical protein L228DRAFT_142218 [Xylona heveae TC161]